MQNLNSQNQKDKDADFQKKSAQIVQQKQRIELYIQNKFADQKMENIYGHESIFWCFFTIFYHQLEGQKVNSYLQFLTGLKKTKFRSFINNASKIKNNKEIIKFYIAAYMRKLFKGLEYRIGITNIINSRMNKLVQLRNSSQKNKQKELKWKKTQQIGRLIMDHLQANLKQIFDEEKVQQTVTNLKRSELTEIIDSI